MKRIINNKQQKVLIILFFLLSLPHFANAQIPTSTVYNYADININSFPIDLTSSPGSTENDYLYSGLYICQTLSKTISTYTTSGGYPKSFTINNPTTGTPFFSVTVDDYCKKYPGLNEWNYRMVFIRPYTTSPSTNKLRTIIMCNGAFSNIVNWSQYFNMGVHDFLMRGYAVAYIETLNNDLTNRFPTYLLGVSICNPAANSDPNAYSAYYSTQFTMAAARFLSGKQNDYGVDSQNIYANGHSAGSLGVYGLAYSNQTNYPTLSTSKLCTGLLGALSPAMGDLNNITLDAYKTSAYTLDAIGIWGGGIWNYNSKYTNIFDSTDKIPAIIYHGLNDGQIPITGSSNHQSLNDIKTQLVNNTVPFGGFVTCNGSHEVMSYNGVQDDPSKTYNTNLVSGDVTNLFSSNDFLDITKVGKPYVATSVTYFSVPANNLKLLKYAFLAKQIHDLGRSTALFFGTADICATAPNINTCMSSSNPGLYGNFLASKTIDFPFVYSPLKVNGHFTVGTCSTYTNLKNPNLLQTSRMINPNQESTKKVTKNAVNIYPSPASNVVNINFGVKTSGVIMISVFDIVGKNISTIINNESIEQGEYSKQFDASNLPSGVYKLIMNSSDGEVITKSIIIQK